MTANETLASRTIQPFEPCGHFVLVECGATLQQLVRVGRETLALHVHDDRKSKIVDAGVLGIATCVEVSGTFQSARHLG